MPLSKLVLIQALKDMPDDAGGVGDSIGVAITKYTTTLTPPVVGAAKLAADNVFIEALNKSNFLVPLPPILGAALDVYKVTLAGIMVLKSSGTITSTPPPAPATPLIRPIFSIPQPKDIFAKNLANVLHPWFKTGICVVNGTGTSFKWT
jgi:hypothetical protein